MLKRVSDDLLDECVELDTLLSSLQPEDWVRVTPFLGWTVRDQVVHLNQVDRLGLDAIRDPAVFARRLADARAGQAAGIELIEQARRDNASLTTDEVLDRWRDGYRTIVATFRAADAKRRMPWFGPDMSLVSFASARQMEVWAHGQDIVDMLGARRVAQARIRNICELGVRTHDWSFRNRGLVPPALPRIALAAPGGGGDWTWNPDGAGLVSGPAEDFALIVTQRRHPDDTAIAATTSDARAWLAIAQCFAGEAATGPAPGERGADAPIIARAVSKR